MNITKTIAIATICISVFTYTTTFAAPADDFVTVWETKTADETITIPINTDSYASGFSYNYTIDCGPTSAAATRTQSGLSTNAVCTYPTPGDHTVRISGSFPAIWFNNNSESTNKDKIKSVEQWGAIQWSTFAGAFWGASNLTVSHDAGVPDLSALVPNTFHFSSMFADTNANPDVSQWDVSLVANAAGMFNQSALSIENYTRLLARWSQQDLLPGVQLGVIGKKYCNTEARATITGPPNSWIITDAGAETESECTRLAADFVTVWRVTAEDLTIPISIDPTYQDKTNDGVADLDTYNYNVDCGGGGATNLTDQKDDASCTYDAAGDYTVRISGTFPAISLNFRDRLKIIDIRQWGTGRWKSFESAFNSASNMRVSAIDVPNLTVTAVPGQIVNPLLSLIPGVSETSISMRRMFAGASVANPDTSRWDTSNVTNMSAMFAGASVANPDTSRWDTTYVTDMSSMFENARAATPDTSGWNTRNVTTMSRMFYRARAATPDTAGWDTRHVTNMSDMFNGASVANPDTSRWDTSKVTTMEQMFEQAYLAAPNTTSWNTSNVTNMSQMFNTARAANPDVSRWDTSKVTNMSQMFNTARAANPDVSQWDVSAVTTASGMFNVSGLSIANYDKLLDAWSKQTLQANVSFGAVFVRYCNGTAGRLKLTRAPNNWIITDRGRETNTDLCAIRLTMDIDGNSGIGASTDGILIARYIASVRGASLIAGAVTGGASRTTASDIEAHLGILIPADQSSTNKPLDIDGNGTVQASTDGILIARYIASVRGESLIAGAIAGGAPRDYAAILSHLESLDI